MHDIWPSLSCVIYMENSNQELKSVALPVSKGYLSATGASDIVIQNMYNRIYLMNNIHLII